MPSRAAKFLLPSRKRSPAGSSYRFLRSRPWICLSVEIAIAIKIYRPRTSFAFHFVWIQRYAEKDIGRAAEANVEKWRTSESGVRKEINSSLRLFISTLLKSTAPHRNFSIRRSYFVVSALSELFNGENSKKYGTGHQATEAPLGSIRENGGAFFRRNRPLFVHGVAPRFPHLRRARRKRDESREIDTKYSQKHVPSKATSRRVARRRCNWRMTMKGRF